jgi:hypothetical protein
MQLLSIPDLESALRAFYSSSREFHADVRARRKENIISFLSINRNELLHRSLEHRLSLYETLCNEKIYIQYPGTESIKNPPMPYDFRPKLLCADGTVMKDASFRDIWDVLGKIGNDFNGFLHLVAAILFRMGYMFEYTQSRNRYDCEALQIENGNIINTISCAPIDLNWHFIDFPSEVWFSLNNYIRNILPDVFGHDISFEAFVKYFDLLLQNEDCKYYYRNVTLEENDNYNLKHGRVSTCNSNLLIIDYLKGRKSISNLLGSFISGRGVANYSVSNYEIVTDGIVIKR